MVLRQPQAAPQSPKRACHAGAESYRIPPPPPHPERPPRARRVRVRALSARAL